MQTSRIYTVNEKYKPSVVNVPIVGFQNEDLSSDTVIKELYEKQEQFEKERKLLISQLLLPVDKRSKELFKKHNISINDKLGGIDNYPKESSLGIKYFCKCFFPMDSTITSERRESGNHYISLGLFNDNFGNSYKFFFPFSITNRPDNNQIGYCLDFLNTFIEEDGSYYNIEGFDYNIYTALYDNLHEPSNKELIEKKFREFGIIDSNGHCTYQIKNKNVMVELFIKNFNNNALDILNFSKSEYNEADNISESVLEGLLFDSETFYKEQTLEEDSENSEDEDSENLPTLENNDSNEDRELNIHLNIPELNKKIFKKK
jgi:hypothetical protein